MKPLFRNVTLVQYHRNGIGGEGFYEVRCEADWDGTWYNVIAILTDTECYMVTPSDPDKKWRGSDMFAADLHEYINKKGMA